MRAINLSLVAILIFVFVGLMLFTTQANALPGSGTALTESIQQSATFDKDKRELLGTKKGPTLSFIGLVDPIKPIRQELIQRRTQ